jgi:hypothetical protein
VGLARGFLSDGLEVLVQIAPRRIEKLLRFALQLPQNARPRRKGNSARVHADDRTTPE